MSKTNDKIYDEKDFQFELLEEPDEIPESVDEFLKILAGWIIEEYYIKGEPLPDDEEDEPDVLEEVESEEVSI